MTLTIRDLESADLEPVARLAAQLVRQHHGFDAARFMIVEPIEEGYRWFLGSQLEDPDTLLLVAEVDGAIAGYLYGSIEERDWALLLDEYGAIHDLFVDEAFRKQGVAKALMRTAIARLGERTPRLVLNTATQNVGAQKLFASLGFRPTMIEMTRT
jgi:ribosomal protein S18 acetylase RimI-like enzyme